MKKDILLLMLKYQISILMIFNIFSQYCINTDLYTYNIEKKLLILSHSFDTHVDHLPIPFQSLSQSFTVFMDDAHAFLQISFDGGRLVMGQAQGFEVVRDATWTSLCLRGAHGVRHPGRCPTPSTGVWGPTQVFEGLSCIYIHYYIVFVASHHNNISVYVCVASAWPSLTGPAVNFSSVQRI